MKKFIFLFAALVSALAFTACSSEDDNIPTPTPEPEPESTATIDMEAYVSKDLLKYADVKLVYYINEEDSIVTPITSVDTIKVVRENLPFTNADLKFDAYIRTTAKNPFPAYENDTIYNLNKKLDVRIYMVTGSKKLTYHHDVFTPWNLLDFEVKGKEFSTYFPESILEYHFKKDKDGSSHYSYDAI